MTYKIVGTVAKITRSTDERAGIGVFFEDGQSARLAPHDPQTVAYADILEELQRMRSPAYVEVNSEDHLITSLLIPLVVKVTGLFLVPSGELQVELEPSHARHVLKPTTHSYDEFVGVLKLAHAKGRLVFVTETQDSHEIIDVQLAPNPKLPATGPMAPAIGVTASTVKPVTPRRARELFHLVSSQSCDPAAIAAPCIPFRYPDDGCWARAHEMCRIIIASGEEPGKLWIYGDLEVKTRNHPDCKVLWIWHVAPTLHVTVGGSAQERVIDPAMFSQPVKGSTWKNKQHDAKAVLVPTDASVFLRPLRGATETDPAYTETLKQLAVYRLRLKLRTAGKAGPPPYTQCS